MRQALEAVFAEDMPRTIRRMHDALEEPNLATIGILATSTRELAESVQANHVADAADRLARSAAEENADECVALVAQLEQEFQAVQPLLDASGMTALPAKDVPEF